MVIVNPSIYDELSERITESPKFEVYYDLIEGEILRSLGISGSSKELTFGQIKFLLESASMLACSSTDEHKQFAYYIVVLIHSQYKEYYDKLSSIVKLILVRLGNFPAYLLLNRILKRKSDDTYAKEDVTFDVEDIPLSLRYESLFRRELNSIEIDGQKRVVTDFQRELFNKLQDEDELSFSAPTSAGKSFLLVLYIVSLLKSHKKLNVVYIVPTKALINQVKRDLKKNLDEFGISEVKVLSSTITFELELMDRSKIDKTILVLTQERLNYLLGSKEIDFPIDILIVDEAQKVSDGSRGVLLERTIIKALKQNIAIKIVFSAPLASNPEFFRVFKPTVFSMRTNYSPVSQNILFVNSKKKQDFLSILSRNNRRVLIRSSELVNDCPKTTAKIAYWAYLFGRGESNIVYRNRPTDTEALAHQLCEYLPNVKHKRIDDFIDFIKEEIHKDYTLIDCLRKGVVFHYSTMPREIKDNVEEMFADEEIPVNYMCCTSTLLEGMNLPAKNIFIHKPKKGVTKNMEMFDFWNLAGRAGRLLKDFYGNIFCIDVDEWEGYVPERTIENYVIESATEESMNQRTGDIIRYLDNPKEPFPTKDRELLEQTTSTFVLDYLESDQQTVERFVQERRLSKIDSADIEKISNSIRKIVSDNKLPREVLEKNSGVDARLQNELYDHFKTQFYLDLMPRHPASGRDFYESLVRIYSTIDRIFLNGDDSKILKRYAVLSSQWIKEEPLSSMIRSDIDYLKSVEKFVSVNRCVQKVVETIENTLIYKYTKYLKCYSDILEFHLTEEGYDEPFIRKLPVYLELGASTETTISLLSFGLSRTTAIRLRKLIGINDMNRTDCREWLNNHYSRTKGHLPVICQEDFEINFA